jgi:hypothetical protein
VVASVLAGTIRGLGLEWPQVTAEKKRLIEESRRQLEAR